MFDYTEFSLNEKLSPNIGEYELIQSKRGNYYRHRLSNDIPNKSWIIESDGFISSNEDVSFENKKIEYIPFLFKKTNSFTLSNCTKLKSLEGSPEIVDGRFSCYGCNALTTLKYSPKEAQSYSCGNCISITSLIGCTQNVQNFYCFECSKLESFEHSPVKVRSFTGKNCIKIKDLKGIPQIISSACDIKGCRNISSFKDMPKFIGTYFDIAETKIRTLDYFDFNALKGDLLTDDDSLLEKSILKVQKLLKQHQHLAEITDYTTFVTAVLTYLPELKPLFKQLKHIPKDVEYLTTFL